MAAVEKKHGALLCCSCLDFFDAVETLSCSHSLCDGCLAPTGAAGSKFITCPRCEAKASRPDSGKADKDGSAKPSDQGNGGATGLCKTCGQDSTKTADASAMINGSSSVPKEGASPSDQRISFCQRHIQLALDKIGQQEDTLRKKHDNVESQIRQRKDMLTNHIHLASVDCLVKLENITQGVLASLNGDRMVLTEKLQGVEEVRDSAGTKPSPKGGHDAGKGTPLKTRNGIVDEKEKLVRLISNLPFHSGFPLIRCQEDLFKPDEITGFIGHVFPNNPTTVYPEVTVSLAFSASKDRQSEVRALCPCTDGRMWAAVQPSPSNEGQVVALFSPRGKEESRHLMTSCLSVARLPGDWVVAEMKGDKARFLSPKRSLEWVYTGPVRLCRLYSKLTARYYLCVHQHRAKFDLRAVDVKSREDRHGDPVISGSKVCSLAMSGTPLAMDVSRDGSRCAVLEQGNKPGKPNKVLVFNTDTTTTTSTAANNNNNNNNSSEGGKDGGASSSTSPPLFSYSPDSGDNNNSGGSSNTSASTTSTTSTTTTGGFQPVDLCFWRFAGGEECLVVADGPNDVLHVLHVGGASCVTVGHVGGGHPLLATPTAVTADEAGKLWVGCRGGNVLVLQQKKESGCSCST